ncbi:SDR family oxidoreductase [Marinobacter nanhaiticus D15-8W]|uniref:SDR family oxidoreductase n=1 Tax=Marinobacter nanhaiticus D15-8W TaxID=626887 RepID=N6W1S5_9GAMM|nr:SDR family oxidoreductase [Marinobacter nanhaiticus]ENO14059.1 SDR family oxidoreductase [Marinobacter nanhaiticus D15-8W]BES71440.1 SDR family oxidoreductase [Marinobacter nanhaiticus D15-8W]
MTSESQKVAIVTGSSRGIGRATAERLASDGFAVVVNYAGNEAKARDAVAAIESNGGRAIAVQGDVSKQDDVSRLFSTAKETFGRIDVVVNSAGTLPMAKISTENLEAFDQVIATNLRGTYLVLAQAAEHLDAGGRIIAFSSSVLGKSFPAYGPYIASKAGVEGLVRVLANELRGRDITVNAVAPGPVATEMFLDGKSDELIEQIAKQAPMERLGQPQDIASAVSFLAGTDGAWVNAQIIRVNGGFV